MFRIPDFTVTDLADVLLMPMLAVFFGMLFFFLGEFNLHMRGRAFWKGIGIAILALGALTGYRFFLAVVSGSFEGKVYRSEIYQRRLLYAHWAAFWLPVVCLLIAIAIVLYRKKMSSRSLIHEEF